ncbi:general odorant-binding protein 19d-like [Vanessa tameamea]|uniref:General odorant-binding protein 19d-like n=1 Tax=Vanessa tameamea TaxID=334116 RepID=A0A8B8IMC9_VANTA
MLKYFMYLFLVYSITAQHEKDNPLAAMVHKTLRATARSCMEKTNATESDLMHLRNDPPFPHKAACIVTCLLKKIGIVEDQVFSKSGFMVIVGPLVFQNKKKLDHMKTVSENCEKEIKTDEDSCKLGNEIPQCVFKYAPELHFKS